VGAVVGAGHPAADSPAENDGLIPGAVAAGGVGDHDLDRAGQAHAWDSLGYAQYKLGNPTAAAGCHRRALDITRGLGDRYTEAQILTHLGDACHAAGEPQEAREAWQRALDILEDLHHPDTAQIRARLHRPEHPASQTCKDTSPSGHTATKSPST
jgi:tetratricopeptide (TPR) repeat protein